MKAKKKIVKKKKKLASAQMQIRLNRRLVSEAVELNFHLKRLVICVRGLEDVLSKGMEEIRNGFFLR